MRTTFRAALACRKLTQKNHAMDREKLLQNPLPIDRVTARVVRAKGEHWTPREVSKRSWVSRPESLQPEQEVPAVAGDYSGMRRGTFTLLRYHSSGKGTHYGSMWLGRCDCGEYELRRGRLWAKKLHKHDCCNLCADRFFALNGRFPGQ